MRRITDVRELEKLPEEAAATYLSTSRRGQDPGRGPCPRFQSGPRHPGARSPDYRAQPAHDLEHERDLQPPPLEVTAAHEARRPLYDEKPLKMDPAEAARTILDGWPAGAGGCWSPATPGRSTPSCARSPRCTRGRWSASRGLGGRSTRRYRVPRSGSPSGAKDRAVSNAGRSAWEAASGPPSIRSRQVVIVGAQPQVRRVFDLCGQHFGLVFA